MKGKDAVAAAAAAAAAIAAATAATPPPLPPPLPTPQPPPLPLPLPLPLPPNGKQIKTGKLRVLENNKGVAPGSAPNKNKSKSASVFALLLMAPQREGLS